MKIKWNGHASFTITADNGTVIVTDPYDPRGYGGALNYDVVRDSADGVLISHDHADHNYVEGLSGYPRVLKGSGQIKGIQIKGIQTFHDDSNGSERGKNTMFVFNVDNLNICFAGDLGHQLSSEQLKDVGSIDILLIPVGGTFTLDGRESAKLVGDMEPKLVIPMHYKTNKCDFPITGVDEFLSKMENIKKFDKSEVDLSLDNLPTDGTEVWILNHAC